MITKFKLYNEAYYPDLTPYTYATHDEAAYPECVNVGWLDKRYPYEKGKVPEGFVERLKNLPIIGQHHGPHICEFCDNKVWSTRVRCAYGNNKFYMVPDMISHYVEVHGYKPPQEFIDVVMNNDMTEKEMIIRFNEMFRRNKDYFDEFIFKRKKK